LILGKSQESWGFGAMGNDVECAGIAEIALYLCTGATPVLQIISQGISTNREDQRLYNEAHNDHELIMAERIFVPNPRPFRRP
jgi:hypothetical protein